MTAPTQAPSVCQVTRTLGPARWDVPAVPASVPQVRRALLQTLREWHDGTPTGAGQLSDEVLDDVATVATELLSNAVLHAPGDLSVSVEVQPDGDLLLQVTDSGAALPAVRPVGGGGTTGRGLHLVGMLTSAWGVAVRPDGADGKVVWCRFGAPTSREAPELDDLLTQYDDPDDALVEIDLGTAPTQLVAAAKDHLDGLLRELALSGGSSVRALPQDVVTAITDAAARFSTARAQLRRRVTEAQQSGSDRVQVRFTVGPEIADAGEAYLAALAQADLHAHDRRLLSLASPAPYRVLREWYVRALVRALQEGSQAPRASFEDVLLAEVQRQESLLLESALPAQLQRVTARLAAADQLEDIADIALEEGMRSLGATGGTVTRPGPERAECVLAVGADADLTEESIGPSAPVGPSTIALREQRAVYVENAADRDLRFPHLATTQPDVAALVALPLHVAGEIAGALRLTWPTPRAFTESERSYLDGLAAQTAQAVARTTALQQVREAEFRHRVLAELGEQLSADRSSAGLAEVVADAVLPWLGDLVVVHLVDEQQRVQCQLVRHRDAALTPDLVAVFDRFPVTTDQPAGAGLVIATGRSNVLPVVDEALVRSVAPDDEPFVQAIQRLDIRSGVIVPLVAGGQTIGALSVARTGAEPMTEAAVRTLEDIGRRAGVALATSRALTTSVRLELALQAADVGSFEMRLPSGELLWDDRLFALLDVDAATFDGSIETFFQRVLPEDLERTSAAIAHAVETAGELAVEYRVQTRSGAIRWVEGRGRVLTGADGRGERLVGVAVDVTVQRDRSTQARRSLELMADGFVQLDSDHRVLYANGQAQRLVGSTSLEGTVLWDQLPDVAAPSERLRVHDDLAAEQPSRFEAWLGPTGSHVEVRAFPVDGGMSLYLTDIGRQRATEDQRDRALARLRLLNDIGADLTAASEVGDALTRLAEHMVPVLADLVSVDLSDDDGLGTRAVVVTSADPTLAELLRAAEARRPRRDNAGSTVHRVLSGEPLVRLDLTSAYLEAVSAGDQTLRQMYTSIQPREALSVPLAGHDRVLGVLSLIRTGADARPFTEEDEQLALEIGRRAGLIVDNAAQLGRQRAVAEELQRSLLPQLPTLPGLSLGSAYEPSSSAAKVGGDWYDAFALPDGSAGVVIGDVMGHDIAAAAAMGQLRSVLRTCAAGGDEPGEVVDQLDHLVSTFAMADLATLVYARVRLYRSGGAELSWSNAGHPPPLLLAPGRPPEFLHQGRSTMVGVEVTHPRVPAVLELPPRSTLLMFTDGLVERRGRDLDEGLQALADAAARLLPASATTDEFCASLVRAVRLTGSTDDVALVAFTLDD